MDESGKKIVIGILVAIAAGVGVYFLVYGVAALSGQQGHNGLNSNSGRPDGDGTTSPEASVVIQAMMGVWQSADDPNFTREFGEHGIVVDRYRGDESATKEGIWGVFTSDMAYAGTTTGLAPDVVYLQITIDDASAYLIVVRAADTLEFVYLDRGGQLNFTRM